MKTNTKLEDLWTKTEKRLLDLENDEKSEIIRSIKYLVNKIRRKAHNLSEEYLKLITGLIKKMMF